MAVALDEDEIRRRVLGVFPDAERIVLFGSRAKGNANPDSDVDLLIVAQSERTAAWRTSAVYMAHWEMGFAFDILVYTPTEMLRQRRFRGGIVEEVEKTGKVLYAA